jgi:hypothetical protein
LQIICDGSSSSTGLMRPFSNCNVYESRVIRAVTNCFFPVILGGGAGEDGWTISGSRSIRGVVVPLVECRPASPQRAAMLAAEVVVPIELLEDDSGTRGSIPDKAPFGGRSSLGVPPSRSHQEYRPVSGDTKSAFFPPKDSERERCLDAVRSQNAGRYFAVSFHLRLKWVHMMLKFTSVVL